MVDRTSQKHEFGFYTLAEVDPEDLKDLLISRIHALARVSSERIDGGRLHMRSNANQSWVYQGRPHVGEERHQRASGTTIPLLHAQRSTDSWK